MATMEVPAALAFSFNKEEALEDLGMFLNPNSNFITFFIDLSEFDRKILVSELVERLEKSSDEDLIFYYDQFKDSQVQEWIRTVLATREDFVKKMHAGDFICTMHNISV